jgi:sigma-54 dependent transcriptional regulator, acetoin dehydrogenase operon transcriptional activator AcoR
MTGEDPHAGLPPASGDSGTSLFDVRTREGLESIKTVRERFLEDPDTDLSAIRPRIAESWRRCAAMRVDPEGPIQVDESARLDEQTLQCAAPYLRELEGIAIDAGGVATIISPQGALISDITPAAEELYPRGRVLLEEVCGTNGDGTALEDGRGGWVYAPEHFRSDMQVTGSFSALVRDPFRDNVRACITLALPEAVLLDSDPRSIGLLVKGTAAKISQELAARSAPREQMLFAEYLKATRRQRNGAVLATDGKNTMVSDQALELLRKDDFAAISSYAQEALRSRRPTQHEVTLSGGRLVELQIAMAGGEADPLGAIVLVKSTATRAAAAGSHGGAAGPAPARPSQSSVFADLVGGSQAFRLGVQMASTAVELGRPAHLIGEAGSGRRAFAARIAEAWCDEVRTFDCAAAEANGSLITAAVAAQLSAGGAVILRDADALSGSASTALSELFAKFERPRIVLTLQRPKMPALALTSTLDSIEIALPPLRTRREDIPALAERFIADITDKRPSARLLYVLAQAEWPGNVAQLKSAVEHAAMAARGSEVRADDLPQGFNGGVTDGCLRRLEEVELHELRAALAEADGNRTRAANILQIGRSTLYRRLDSYRRRGIVI